MRCTAKAAPWDPPGQPAGPDWALRPYPLRDALLTLELMVASVVEVASLSTKTSTVRTVLAIGGNALDATARSTISEEFRRAETLAQMVARLASEGAQLVVTHGNGPQVGFVLHQSEVTARLERGVPEYPLDYLVAETQGGIGYILTNRIDAALARAGLGITAVSVVTQTLVSSTDPAFARPTKPVGSFYSAGEAERFRAQGWPMVEDSGRGYRRVVASPQPCRIIEAEAVAALLDAGFMVVAAGGGGIPVVERNGRLEGVAAVVDKDAASAVLATQLGARRLIICTSVAGVALSFGRPEQRFLDELDIDRASTYLDAGEFPPGNMGPKIQAAIHFIRAGGEDVLITSIDRLADALQGRAGTRITRG